MKGYLISLWGIIDPFYYYCSRLTYLPNDNIFRIRLTKYKGRNVVLSDGTQINKNDTLLKIHLHNVRLMKELKNVKNELKKAKIIYRYVQRSMPGLELYLRHHCPSRTKAIIGITLLNKGCERLGFEIFDIRHPAYKWLKWCSFLPIEMLSSNKSAAAILKNHRPKYLFISKEKLVKLYRTD
ncbi:hypothetical protein J9303_15110 [Bacillaceae bacterium Marseille-Q3522]|nr:hypothetical protein [Bacillaceae bacterium Marseille-Q3522]